MAIIDNTLAANVPTFEPANSLMQVAQMQNAQTVQRQNEFKQMQAEIGSEARGLVPFVNTPEFPARWAETADRMAQKGLLSPQQHQQWRNAPSPLMLKQMISQTEDPTLTFRKEEAGREQKNQDRSYGLQVRAANRADDPTPDGFEKAPGGGYQPLPGGPVDPSYLERVAMAKAKAAATIPPDGFAKQPDGTLAPLPGGPSDPNYLQSAAAAKAKIPRIIAPGEAVVDMGSGKETYKNAGGGGSLPDEVADFAAEQILLGKQGVKTGYGRGAQGPENIAKIDAAVARLAKERGISAADLVQRGIDLIGDTGRERTAATQEGRMSSAGIEAQGAIKLGKEASDLVPRTSWVPVNKAIQAYQSNTSDPNLKRFGAANLTIINTYARAINPNGVGTVADKEHASEMLRTADGPEAYNAVLDQLNKEIDMAHKSPAMARQGFKEERARRTSTKAPANVRFNQLTAGGMSKDEAYAKMHEEGY